MPGQDSLSFDSRRCGRWIRWSGIASVLLAVWALLPMGWAADKNEAMQRVPPKAAREFRGAWIATVANLDWPSKPGLTSAQQKEELQAIMDKAVQLKLNVLVLQVRSACDAFYHSPLEPWSEFITGQMGRAPDPYYDPLEFAVDEAHRRGLELHAWFNPFRVRAPNPKSGPATNHVTQTHPEWVRRYGSQVWLDPGLKAVQAYCSKVILDVVKRYDIDGVHLDDYFYPYPEKNTTGQLLDFPDEASWRRSLPPGSDLERDDWRRQNIDRFVEDLYHRIKAEKRWVKLGISPFGIWRPGFPKQIKGLDSYEHLYADSRKWLDKGWVDYLAPQLYWEIDGADHSYPALLEWWVSQNTQRRHLIVGNDLNKVGTAWRSSEIVKQVRLTRKQSGAGGNILWGIGNLLRNNDHLADAFAKELYTQPALVPASPWLSNPPPAKPVLKLEIKEASKPAKLAWTNPSQDDVWLWLCQTRVKGKWTSTILPGHKTFCALPRHTSAAFPDLVAVTPINRCSGAGPTAVLDAERALGLLTSAKGQDRAEP